MAKMIIRSVGVVTVGAREGRLQHVDVSLPPPFLPPVGREIPELQSEDGLVSYKLLKIKPL